MAHWQTLLLLIALSPRISWLNGLLVIHDLNFKCYLMQPHGVTLATSQNFDGEEKLSLENGQKDVFVTSYLSLSLTQCT